jgi:lipid-binding SYLF domain-containing protein
MSKRPTLIMLAFLLVVFAVVPLGAQEAKASAEVKRAADATAVLTEIMNIPDDAIPDELMARAHGIAVIPHVVKGAFGFGGQWGKGLTIQRLENGTWSAPSFIDLGGGSFGLQIGVQATDIVLVFTDEDGLKHLMKAKLKLGADASAAAGPVGRKAEVGTDVLLRSSVFAYSRSKGLFAGISLDGSVISIDDSANRKIYGKDVTADQILSGKLTANEPQIEKFVMAVQKVSVLRKTSIR